jgi:hypothetical protein
MPIILSLWQVEKILLFRKGAAYKLSLLEIGVATIYFSLITEILFPLFSEDFKGDRMDVVACLIGSTVFYVVNINSHNAKVTFTAIGMLNRIEMGTIKLVLTKAFHKAGQT